MKHFNNSRKTIINCQRSVINCLIALALVLCYTGCKDDEETDIPVTGITASVETLTLEIAQKETLTATIAPSNATVKRYSWESSDKKIVDVTNAGVVTAIAKGTANIILKSPREGFTDTIKVTVLGPVIKATGVKLDKTAMSIKVGSTGQLTATVSPTDATDKTVTWSSENNAIATVNSSGVVTGVAIGATNIVVKTTDGNFTATSAITVLTADVAVTGVSLNKNKLDLTKGSSEKLNATVTPANATNSKISWKSADINVATVDASGTVTAVGVGTTTITVTTEDGSYTAQAEVTVKEATGVAGIYSGTVTMDGNPAAANVQLEIKYTSETTISIDTRATVMMIPLHIHGDAIPFTLTNGVYTISGTAITDNFGYGPKNTTINGTVDANGNISLTIKVDSISQTVGYSGKKK